MPMYGLDLILVESSFHISPNFSRQEEDGSGRILQALVSD